MKKWSLLLVSSDFNVYPGGLFRHDQCHNG